MIRKLWKVSGCIILLSGLGVSHAQTTSTQDVPDPFVTTVQVDAVNNFNYTPVAIPSGKRLVVDYVSMSGAASGNGGAIQPIVILDATLIGGAQNLFYFAPPVNTQLNTQYYMAQNTEIFADGTLLVGPAFAGFSPNFDTFNVVITGHLIANPPSQKGPPISPLGAEAAHTRAELAKIGITAP